MLPGPSLGPQWWLSSTGLGHGCHSYLGASSIEVPVKATAPQWLGAVHQLTVHVPPAIHHSKTHRLSGKHVEIQTKHKQNDKILKKGVTEGN